MCLCEACGEELEDTQYACWSCGLGRDGEMQAAPSQGDADTPTPPTPSPVQPSGTWTDSLFGIGRIGRGNYLGVNIAVILLALSSLALPPMIFVAGAASLYLLLQVPRRLHDLGMSAWLTLLLAVPALNVFLKFYLLFAAGDEEPNAYGPPPSRV